MRYADDCNIYVKSNNVAWKVMGSATRFLSKKLRLKVNGEKSRIDRPWNLKYLGYSVTRERKLKPAPQSINRFKQSLRKTFREGRGRSTDRITEELNRKLRGWANYFKLAEVKLIFEELDKWIRRKIRCILWRQWKRPYRRAKNLMNCGTK